MKKLHSIILTRHRLRLGGLLVLASGLLVPGANAFALPAGWSYELVSPSDTHGASVGRGGYASIDGDRAWIIATVPLGPNQPTGNASTYAAARGPNGWVSANLADASAPSNNTAAVAAVSADGASAILQHCDATLLGCAGATSFERVDSGGARITMLVAPGHFGSALPTPEAVSRDTSRLFVSIAEGEVPLLPADDTHTAGRGIYVSHNGSVEFLGYDENGQVLPCGATVGNNDTEVGSGFEQSGISTDGRTVIFESPDPRASCPGPIELYLRHDGTSVNISRPQNGKPDLGATYAGNSPDGSRVYFRTPSQMVASDTDGDSDIYVYDRNTHSVTPVTSGAAVTQVAVSPEGTYVYFTASNPIGGQGTVGGPNFFVHHDGTTRLIAVANVLLGSAVSSGTQSPITPSGTHIAFLSNTPLTGAALSGTFQIFQYSVNDEDIVCATCPADGSAPVEDANFPHLGPQANVNLRNQSDDGRVIAFNTAAPLDDRDTNGTTDVYMWREGNQELISNGQGPFVSAVVGMSADGKSVFFTSNDRLTPFVKHDDLKMYVARLGGGFASAATLPVCEDDDCQAGTAATKTTRPEVGSMKVRANGRDANGAGEGAAGIRRLLLALRAKLRQGLRAPGSESVRATVARQWVQGIRVMFAARVSGRWKSLRAHRHETWGRSSVVFSLVLTEAAHRELARRGSLQLRIAARRLGDARVHRMHVLVHADGV